MSCVPIAALAPDNGFDMIAMAAEICREEPMRRTVTDDATGLPIEPGTHCKGKPVIGIGRVLCNGGGVSTLEAHTMLMSDLRDALAELAALAWFRALDPVRQRSIMHVRMALKMPGLMALHPMIRALDVQDYNAAYAAGMESHWAASLAPGRAYGVFQMLRSGIPISHWP